MRGTRNVVVAVAAALAVSLGAGEARAEAMDLNTAPAADLATLEGLTEELARNIVREREENGLFAGVEDLARVPGVTAEVIAKLRPRVVAGITAPVSRGKSTVEQEVARVLKKFAHEPTVQEVQDEATDYARANPGLIDSWRIRSRIRSVAPQFRVNTGYDGDRNYQWRQSAGAGTFVPPQPSGTTPRTDNLNNNLKFGAQATWNLDQLIYDPEEPKVNREAVRLAKHRDQVVDDVTRRYFERRRLQVELELNPPTDVGDRLRKEIRLQELTADLDGLTGGYFSEQVRKRKKK
jgi:competence ComEA-like helix-hairpin-helix protein